MSWSQSSVSDASRMAAALLDDAVSNYRNRGHTRETALGMAAKVLGVTLRRARGLLYGEPVALRNNELDAIRAAFLNHLDEEAETLKKRLQAIRERQRAMDPETFVKTPQRRRDDPRSLAA